MQTAAWPVKTLAQHGKMGVRATQCHPVAGSAQPGVTQAADRFPRFSNLKEIMAMLQNSHVVDGAQDRTSSLGARL